MSDRIFTAEEKAKLNALFNEGIGIMVEVKTLNEGLNDTVKAVAEEMNIPSSVLKKAMNIAAKSNFQEEREKHEQLEAILETVGRTL